MRDSIRLLERITDKSGFIRAVRPIPERSRSGVSKIEARLSYVDDKMLLYLPDVLKVPVQDLFPARTGGNRLHEFMEKLETTRF